MKRFFKIALFGLIAIGLVINCSLPPYSQTQIMKRSRRILAESDEYYLGRWFERSKRVSLDTLCKISAPNISQFDNVRNAIFNYIAEIKDTTVLRLMSIKVVSGNPIEKLTASAYIYRYYGIEMRGGQHLPLASLLVLFHSAANNLRSISSPFYRSVEQRAEIAKTFPKSEGLYHDFILNRELSFPARNWFVESLLEHSDREIVTIFLLNLESKLEDDDPIAEVLNKTIYTLMNRGTQGDWVTFPQ
jgi:hypothetical protein